MIKCINSKIPPKKLNYFYPQFARASRKQDGVSAAVAIELTVLSHMIYVTKRNMRAMPTT